MNGCLSRGRARLRCSPSSSGEHYRSTVKAAYYEPRVTSSDRSKYHGGKGGRQVKYFKPKPQNVPKLNQVVSVPKPNQL